MDYQYDLFISYASEDRPWAERLYEDIKTHAPKLTCFWDRESLKVGEGWQEQLETRLAGSRHFVVLWSSKAEKEGGWVGPEIEKFQVQAKTTPTDERTLFYVPLQGKRGSLENLEGLPDIREGKFYELGAEATEDQRTGRDRAWARIVSRIIGGIHDARAQGRPIPVGMLVANEQQFLQLNPAEAIQGVTLAAYLEQLGLDLATLRKRYKPSNRDWAPFEAGVSIEDLLEPIRNDVNAAIGSPIRWKWIDLTDAPAGKAGLQRVNAIKTAANSIAKVPSLLVIDPISLYHPTLREIYAGLAVCFQSEDVVVFCPSPRGPLKIDTVTEELAQTIGYPHLDHFFTPLPPTRYPLCGVNLCHGPQLKRLVSGSLGRKLWTSDQGDPYTPLPAGVRR
jgi:hypothetical protein